MPRLQIGLELDVSGDAKPEIRLTPVDLEMPPDIAVHARKLVMWLDSRDPQPKDGEADVPFRAKVPVGGFVKVDVPVKGNFFLKVRE
jgi:hypothetical protein